MRAADHSRDCGVDDNVQQTTELETEARLNRFLLKVERRAFITAKLATKDDEEALDIVQDAMLKLAQKYSQRSEDELGALFHTILQSRINDWHRRQTVRRRWRVFFNRSLDDEDEGANDPEEWVPQELFPEPDRQFVVDELNERLLACITALPLRQQQAVVLRAWEGYDIAQTAQIMQCSEGSVKTHYSRALNNLRGKLGDYG